MWRDEETHCERVKSYLPASKKAGRANALVMFIEAGTRHTRTVRARDIIEIGRTKKLP